MGYDWDDKRDVCYRLYVEEKRPLEEVVDYFRDKMKFVPSKRTFQTQFRRWGFPTKLDYSHRDEVVVQRVREMWDQNYMQKEMLSTLQAEGHNVSASGLMRLRFKHGLHLKSASQVRAAVDANNNNNNNSSNEPNTESGNAVEHTEPSSLAIDAQPGEKRKDRDETMRTNNDEKWKSKKRRRHTKEWNGLPPDPPGPPRYPSETTIGEAQKFLGLDDDMYREVRDRFRDICTERDIVKKTICGPERWEAAKESLVQENPYFQQLFLTSDTSMLAPLQLSLDIICMDVTKHIRTQSKTMSLAEAKNTLGLNPLESRILKQKLIDILVAHDFVNTYESENWSGLKDEWLEGTTIKDRMPLEEGPARERFLKAIQLLCRDTLKRWREAQRKSSSKEPMKSGSNAVPGTGEKPQRQAQQPKPARRARQASNLLAELAEGEAQIDPSLLQAANTSSVISSNHDDVAALYPAPAATDMAAEPPLAVYFRRSPLCADASAPPLWLGALSTRTIQGLHQTALGFVGGQDYAIARIDGVSPGPDGGELLYQIDHDDELQGYLIHNEGRKATFVVQLLPHM
ncbi:hypothetical protein K461DRAFT_270062 [Myriangium duriaei CBS 260.36]|uniref:Clr5 domain-containing protein n=1 Tax=Myriangium duriaei CBS 260.36 TaxID=1168546 RepID=A0A9P4ME23_9PEZI|nr:hypothetical protein K461DRAFT_270062 [Myriangium duriaei CBS 260.36]